MRKVRFDRFQILCRLFGNRPSRPRVRARQRRTPLPPRLESLETRLLLTTIYVDVDASGGDGSIDNPFRTIQDGLNRAAQLSGDDTVVVAPGTYTEGLIINDASGAVELLGSVTAQVLIQPPDTNPDSILILNASQVTIAHLALADGNDTGIKALSGNLDVRNVRATGHDFAAIYVLRAGNVSVSNSTLDDNTRFGLYVEESGEITLSNVFARRNALDGMHLRESGQVTVNNVTASNNARWGITVIANLGAAHIEDVTANQNGAEGLGVYNAPIDLTVIGGQFHQNGWHGIDVTGASSVTIQDTEVVGNGADSARSTTGGAGIRVHTTTAGATLLVSGAQIRDNISQRFEEFAGGGGMHISGSVVATIENTTITGNKALFGEGGGINFISTGANSVIRNSIIANNQAGRLGGGISYRLPTGSLQGGSLLIEASTFDNNTVESHGGGLFADRQTVTIRRSTFSNNTATLGDGGGLTVHAQAFIENSTFTGNSARHGGGVAMYETPFDVRLNQVTIANNTATGSGGGGGIFRAFEAQGSLVLANTLVAQNTHLAELRRSPDISGDFVSLSYNLIGDVTGSRGASGSDLVGSSTNPIDPRLDVLRDNGGPTQTLALFGDSPAIDAVGATNLPLATDQRGLPRPQGSARDIGAYESQDLGQIRLALNVFATQLNETGTGTSSQAQVSLVGGTLLEDLVVTLSSNDASEVTLPSQVVILAGNSAAQFTVTAVSDGFLDGNQTVTLRADAAGFQGATDLVTIIDNDSPNTQPVAQDLTFNVFSGQTLNGQMLATDADGDTLTYQIVDGPDHHFAFGSFSSGSFNYRSQSGFRGTDSFTYRAFDGHGFSDIATVTINVLNNPPVAANDAYAIAEDITLVVPATPAVFVDQRNETGGASLHVFNAGGLDLQQQVVSTITGKLQSVDVFIYDGSDPGKVLDFFVNKGAPWQTDAPNFRLQYTLKSADIGNWITLDVSAANIQLQQGEIFTIGAFSTSPNVFLLASNSDFGGDHYTPGSLWVDGAKRITPGGRDYDLFFRTRMSTTAGTVGGVLSNDTDAEGDRLTAFLVSGTANGQLTLNPDGSFQYTPNANFHGTDSFTYQTYDGNALSQSATVTITVNPVNDPPVAVDNAYTIAEDGSINALAPGLLANDQDVEGDPLTANLVQNVANGLLQFNSNGSFLYTPNENFHGTDSFTYRVHDGNLFSTNVATVTITVEPRPDAPVANDDLGLTTPEETPITINVLANDTDADGDALSIVQVQSVIGGTAAANPDGTITFTPDSDFFGTATFNYAVTDGTNRFDSATVVVSVMNINDAPVANPDSATTNEETLVLIAVLTNDTDADGNALTVQSVGSALHGSVQIGGDGRVAYTPNANFHGSDSFTYAVVDGNGGRSTGTVSITVLPVNDAPVAGNDTVSTDEESPVVISVLTNDSDVDGDPLTVSLVNGTLNGELTQNPDGTFRYVPRANFHGSDSFTYQVNDGSANSNVATVSITVLPVNDAPTAGNDAVATDEDVPLVVAVLANDSDIEGDALSPVIVTGPSHGTVEQNADGTITYSPNANFHGSDSFTYLASDGSLDSNVAIVSITVGPVNDAPVAGDDAVSVNEDASLAIAVLANDSDVEGNPLAVSLVTGASNGTLTLNADGSMTYTPNANFHGSDSFTYQVNDGSANSNVATVSITVLPVNDAPTAGNDAVATDEDVPLVIAVLANDSDLEGDVLLVTLASQPANGTAVVNANGTVTYTPNANFNGSDSFTYQISDGNGGLDLATVSITIRPDADLGLPILDIVPTDPNNGISSSSKFDIAILSSAEFDVRTRIVVSSLTFGRTGDEDSLVRHKKTGAIQFRYEDVNGDGLLDLVVSVDGKKTGLSTGDTQAFLKADDANGTEYALSDEVSVSSKGGGGKGGGKGGKSPKAQNDAFFLSLSDEDEDWPF